MKSLFKLSALVAALGVTALGVVPAAQAAAAAEPPTVVFVHGAFIAWRDDRGGDVHLFGDQGRCDWPLVLIRDEQTLRDAERRRGRGAELWHSILPFVSSRA